MRPVKETAEAVADGMVAEIGFQPLSRAMVRSFLIIAFLRGSSDGIDRAQEILERHNAKTLAD